MNNEKLETVLSEVQPEQFVPLDGAYGVIAVISNDVLLMAVDVSQTAMNAATQSKRGNGILATTVEGIGKAQRKFAKTSLVNSNGRKVLISTTVLEIPKTAAELAGEAAALFQKQQQAQRDALAATVRAENDAKRKLAALSAPVPPAPVAPVEVPPAKAAE